MTKKAWYAVFLFLIYGAPVPAADADLIAVSTSPLPEQKKSDKPKDVMTRFEYAMKTAHTLAASTPRSTSHSSDPWVPEYYGIAARSCLQTVPVT